MQTADALAQTAEEGRIWRRYSSRRSQNPVIRRFPNGATHPAFGGVVHRKSDSHPEHNTEMINF